MYNIDVFQFKINKFCNINEVNFSFIAVFIQKLLKNNYVTSKQYFESY